MKTAYFIINHVQENKIDKRVLSKYLEGLRYINGYILKFNLYYNRIVIKIYYDPKIYKEERLGSVLNKIKKITKLQTIPMFVR